METPIVSFVNEYIKNKPSRFHVPGHKGRVKCGGEPFDITEVTGAGNLYSFEGIIAESEKIASRLFGFGGTFYSTEGSSQCVKVMLYLAKKACLSDGSEGGRIIAERGAHRSLLSALAFCNIDVNWVYSEKTKDGKAVLSKDELMGAVNGSKDKPFALFVTSPDYYGRAHDIARLAAFCRENGMFLLVDNAHGAYMRFLSPSAHPVSLGAFMSSDSAHKTLPVYTGGAYLQLSVQASAKVFYLAKSAISLFCSTSPSYLTLCSLDRCNAYLSDGYAEKLSRHIKEIEAVKQKAAEKGFCVLPSDPLRMVIDAKESRFDGREIAAILCKNHVEAELYDKDSLVLMTTPENTPKDFEKLLSALDLCLKLKKSGIGEHTEPHRPLTPKKQMTVKQALESRHEEVITDLALGRTLAFPPFCGTPETLAAVSGEVIDQSIIDFYKEKGVKSLLIVKDR
ncbi:MAG: amino acid decarboxylase [Eubacteriales bacterium]